MSDDQKWQNQRNARKKVSTENFRHGGQKNISSQKSSVCLICNETVSVTKEYNVRRKQYIPNSTLSHLSVCFLPPQWRNVLNLCPRLLQTGDNSACSHDTGTRLGYLNAFAVVKTNASGSETRLTHFDHIGVSMKWGDLPHYCTIKSIIGLEKVFTLQPPLR